MVNLRKNTFTEKFLCLHISQFFKVYAVNIIRPYATLSAIISVILMSLPRNVSYCVCEFNLVCVLQNAIIVFTGKVQYANTGYGIYVDFFKKRKMKSQCYQYNRQTFIYKIRYRENLSIKACTVHILQNNAIKKLLHFQKCSVLCWEYA